MGRLRSIDRTAVFAWSNGAGSPLMVTGTRTGALDDSFSSETKLELWDLHLNSIEQGDKDLKPAGTITTDAGFNDVAWSEPTDDHPLGVIAGALENGSIDLWDAEKLRNGGEGAFISRTTKHSGAAKALQWNPYRHNLLASVGAKGEIFIYDLNNMANPFRLGASAARADDYECLDWNKQEKTAHILATGSKGGFVTVWDVKQKKDILTLNNQGRKAVSAVAWDPEESTKLATASANDQEPTILLWSLRNSSAPERTLKGHELGVLGLSWCLQDTDLLLSCGKDNNTICWNARTGEQYGSFAPGSNWAFQTRWNPHNPSLIASASFDGKILISSTQSTNSKPEDQAQANQALDDSDFFAKAQSQPQDITFSIPKTPKWAARPSSVSFGFGGKLVRVAAQGQKKSKVSIETFSVETSIGESAQAFEERLQKGDTEGILTSKLEAAKTDEEKADWQVIETLNAGKSRKKLREYLGFQEDSADELSKKTASLDINGSKETNGEKSDDFFGSVSNDDSFLADLAATKGAKTNNPFSIYTGSESDADKAITHALLLGNFESAMGACLEEDRMSDAFMIAVCGGQKCIDKVQAAYLRKQGKGGKSYLRILASIVGKNLWDMVHNADLGNWKEVMATLCTYADESEFADLCEALGDRLEESFQADEGAMRRDASFCYLAGSKLEKVVSNWVEELREQEKSALDAEQDENDFSVHARCLQDFMEKVSVFRKVTNFQDSHEQQDDDWKLAPLYALYAEYADILAAHGQLTTAEQYLDLLPGKFGGAESAQQRVKQATKKAGASSQRQPAPAAQRSNARIPPTPQATIPAVQPLIGQARNPAPSQYTPAGPTPAMASNSQGPYGAPANQYAPAGVTPSPYAPASNTYAPAGYQPSAAASNPYGGYQPPQPAAPLPPPPRAGTASPSMPPPQAKNVGDWNDMPENFLKQNKSRRGTPGPQPVSSPFPNAPQNVSSPPLGGPPQFGQPRGGTPLPPPPRAGEGPPRVTSPPIVGVQDSQPRPSSSAGKAYAPPQPSGNVGSTLPTPSGPPIPRGSSPYQPPPSTSSAAPSNRYAPAPGAQGTPAPGGPYGQRQVAPNPYMQPPQQPQSSPYAPSQSSQQGQYGQLPPQNQYGQPPPPQAQPTPPPPRGGPPSGPPRATGPPPSGPPRNSVSSPSNARQTPLPQTAADAKSTAAENASPAPQQQKHPRGDRSHVPTHAQPIVDLLVPEVNRIKAVAPAQFKPQVEDMEKRINILFDHLNNDDLLSEETVGQMVEISRCIQNKEWERAMGSFTEMQTAKLESEGTHWMVSRNAQT